MRNPFRPNHKAMLPKHVTKFPIVAAIFAAGGIYYSISSSARREGQICVDCDRQKQIAEEVYFKKKTPVVQKGYRL